VGGVQCLGVAIEHDLYKNIGDIYVCTDFEMLEVEVPTIFFGTQGFSARRNGRYANTRIIEGVGGIPPAVSCCWTNRV